MMHLFVPAFCYFIHLYIKLIIVDFCFFGSLFTHFFFSEVKHNYDIFMMPLCVL